MDNFIDDMFRLKKYPDDPAVTDMFVIGTGEIIVKKFAAGKVFTGEFVSPSKVRGIILSAAALLDKKIDPVNGLPKLEVVIPPPYNARNPPPRPEAEVPLRITGMLPPWVASPEITLRKPPRVIFPKEPTGSRGLCGKKRLSPAEYDLVCRYVRERKNLLIGGGKSTFTNAVSRKWWNTPPTTGFTLWRTCRNCNARRRTRP
jgi:type IV secretion system protein VirB11